MEEKRGVTGATLKLVAILTMLVDHTAAIILERMEITTGVWSSYPIETWYTVMRAIGRMAFPIFCFLLVEGFCHTKNVKKYAVRLGIFALVSEIPFDLSFNNRLVDFSYNNVFFTLLLGLIAIWGMEQIPGFCQKKWGIEHKKWIDKVALLAWLLLLMGAAYLLHTDYNCIGVVTIAIMYQYRKQPILGYVLAIVILGLYSYTEFFALATVPLIVMYNGKRGKQLRYFFYGFYPGHLLILDLICIIIGLPLLK